MTHILSTVFPRFSTRFIHKILRLTGRRGRLYCELSLLPAMVTGVSSSEREGVGLSLRTMVVGLLAGMAALAMAPVPGAGVQAASATSWQSSMTPGMRPQFRPWAPRAVAVAPETRWRPHRSTPLIQPPPRHAAPTRQAPVVVNESRYTAPVTRAFARTALSGVRFRPQGRAAEVAAARVDTTPIPRMAGPNIHARFRPMTTPKRPSYEALHGNSAAPTQLAWRPYSGPRVYAPPPRSQPGFRGDW
jgi:hypothetical protein